MQTLNNQDWIYNIENLAGEACRNATPEHVRDVFVLYGATSADDLDPSNYEAVFSELQLLAYDFQSLEQPTRPKHDDKRLT